MVQGFTNGRFELRRRANSRNHTVEPPVSDHHKCEDLVFALIGEWTHRGSLPIYFLEDVVLRAIVSYDTRH